MKWQPIETAPKSWRDRILVCWPNGWVTIAHWKDNPRLKDSPEGLSPAYFSDNDELDDYDLAKKENAPTHWMPLPAPPVSQTTINGGDRG